eukprot:gb/GECH01003027.1/.p1 GENE.gb/GECH01003027.1/~~gb/GECH01003027.1/.p1  ORF type:complete len:243 (+),score=58.04 gb/GECH01003027.1/:1-729(+)
MPVYYDIEDNSRLRRGVPVAHSIYGVPATINCANYVYFLALRQTSNLGDPRATQVFVDELIQLHQGQGWDIYWRDNSVCPTEDEYKQMVIDKTGGLFRLAIGLMTAFSHCQHDFIPLVNTIGLYFQILDDYLNIKSPKYHHNKSFFEDLTEGKYSFPIIHSIQHSGKDRRLQNILMKKTSDLEMKKYALKIMEETESLNYTRKELERLKKSIEEQINTFGGNQKLIRIIESLHSQLNDESKA